MSPSKRKRNSKGLTIPVVNDEFGDVDNSDSETEVLEGNPIFYRHSHKLESANKNTAFELNIESLVDKHKVILEEYHNLKEPLPAMELLRKHSLYHDPLLNKIITRSLGQWPTAIDEEIHSLEAYFVDCVFGQGNRTAPWLSLDENILAFLHYLRQVFPSLFLLTPSSTIMDKTSGRR